MTEDLDGSRFEMVLFRTGTLKGLNLLAFFTSCMQEPLGTPDCHRGNKNETQNESTAFEQASGTASDGLVALRGSQLLHIPLEPKVPPSRTHSPVSVADPINPSNEPLYTTSPPCDPANGPISMI